MTAIQARDADFRFLFLTDTHIMAGSRYQARDGSWELDTAATLRQVVDVIAGLDRSPDFVVLGGDLASPDIIDRTRRLSAQDYTASYELLQELIAPLPCSVHMLLGNHDHRAAFHTVMGSQVPSLDTPHDYSFSHQGHHFIALDSHHPGQDGGRLDPPQLQWLREDLRAHAAQPTMVFIHHHPWPVGHPWLDVSGLERADVLLDLLAEEPQVRWLICGHVHMDVHHQLGNLAILSTASTCFQASRLSAERLMLPGPPSFRIVDVKGTTVSTRTLALHSKHPDGL